MKTIKLLNLRKWILATVVCPLAFSANAQSSCPGLGKISFQKWKNVSGTNISDIPLDSAPSSSGVLYKFEGAKDVDDNYGQRIRGFICPPATGNYTFWIASDDKSELWLSTTASPADKQLIAYVPTLTGSRHYDDFPSQKSAKIFLNKGQQYYIEALHKEGNNHDNISVGWQLPSGSKERPIPGKRLSPFVSAPLSSISYNPGVFGIIGDFGLDGAPEAAVANLVKSWNPGYILTVGDNNYPDGEAATIDQNVGKYYHQFIKPYYGSYGLGADTNRFFPCLGNHDWTTSNAAAYFQYFTLPGSERYYDFVKGDIHFFCIDSDFNEPDGNSSTSVQAVWLKTKLAASSAKWKVVYFHHAPYSSDDAGSQTWMRWPFKNWGADIAFSGHSHVYERIVKDGFPFIIVGTGGGPLSAFLTPLPDSKVRYNLSYGAMRGNVTGDTLSFQFININNEIIDTINIVKSGAPLISYCPKTGGILREFWDSLSGVNTLQIPDSAPTSTNELEIFETPVNFSNNYVQRVRGYVCPPLSGNYIFWIASDDNSELWLSTDEHDSNKVKIAYVNGWTSSRDWIKFPSQQSAPIYLNSNNKYYIEAVHSELAYGDNLAVGWQLPDQKLERPIPGHRLIAPSVIQQVQQSPELIPQNSLWKYLDNGSNQGTAWRNPSYNDSLWKTGNAELGYGDGDEATKVGFGSSSGSKYITTYFRKSFTVSDTTGIKSLKLNIIRDDGIVVYLNGYEVYRNNMPTTTIYYNTLAPSFIDGSGETTWLDVDVSSSKLLPGNNILAVEIHQNSPSSSDISFNLKLAINFVALKTEGKSADAVKFNENDSIYYSKGDLIIYPNPSTGSFTMEYCRDYSDEKDINVEIFNPIGQILFQKKLNIVNGCVMDILEFHKDIPDGRYIMNINLDGNRESKQIILTR